MASKEFHVTGMTCSHCENAVTEEVTSLDGVDSIEVSAQTGRLVVHLSGDVSDEDIIAAVDEAGYEAVAK